MSNDLLCSQCGKSASSLQGGRCAACRTTHAYEGIEIGMDKCIRCGNPEIAHAIFRVTDEPKAGPAISRWCEQLGQAIFELRKRNIDDIALGLIEPITREMDQVVEGRPAAANGSQSDLRALVGKLTTRVLARYNDPQEVHVTEEIAKVIYAALCAGGWEAALRVQPADGDLVIQAADELEIFAKAQSSRLCDPKLLLSTEYKHQWEPEVLRALEIVEALRAGVQPTGEHSEADYYALAEQCERLKEEALLWRRVAERAGVQPVTKREGK